MANTTGGQIVWDLTIDDSGFGSRLRKASSEADSFSNNINKIDFRALSSSASDAFGTIASGIEDAIRKTALLVAGGGGIGTVFLKSAADLQQTSKSFEVLTGNVEVANKLFSQLADFAAKTPFEFPDIAKAGKTLLGFGISSDKVFSQVQLLGDIAAATGADFSSLAVVFGQVNATGRLMGQDALQLINNNIPITTILAKKLGVSVQEVKKQMEEGALSADLFNQALLEQTQKGGFAFKGTEVLAQSLNGRLSTLKDTALEFGRNLLGVKVDPKLGLTIKPGGIFDRLSNLIPVITSELSKFGPIGEKAFNTIIENGDTVKAVLGGVAVAFIAAKVAAVGFALATAVNPITILATAIVLLVASLTFVQIKFGILNKAFDYLQPKVETLWKTIQSNLLPVLTKLWIEAIQPLVTAIGTLLVGALGLLIDSINFLLPILTRFSTWLIDNKPLVIALGAAVLSFWAILKARDAIDSFMSGFTIAKDTVQSAIGAIKGEGGLAGLNKSLTGFTGFAVFASLAAAAVAYVISKFDEMNQTIKNTQSAIDANQKSNDVALQRARQQYKEGKISKERLNQIIALANSAIPSFASGIQNFGGGLAFVHKGEALVNLSKGSSVYTKDETQDMMAPNVTTSSNSSGFGSKLEQNNTFNVYNQVDLTQGLRDIAWQLGN